MQTMILDNTIGWRQAIGELEQTQAYQVRMAGDISLIQIERRGVAPARDLLGRVFSALGQIDIPILMISHSSWKGDCCFVVPAAHSMAALEALHAELIDDFERGDVLYLKARNDVMLFTATAFNTISGQEDMTCIYDILAASHVNILATTHNVSTGKLSLIVAKSDYDVVPVLA